MSLCTYILYLNGYLCEYRFCFSFSVEKGSGGPIGCIIQFFWGFFQEMIAYWTGVGTINIGN